jgi:carboxypeptidase C (cathepsin A)
MFPDQTVNDGAGPYRDYGVTGWSGFADTSEALRHAFAKNPYMRVYIAEGLYDAATPYFAVDYTFNHMGLTAEAHKNVSRSRFSAGHMVYIDDASMKKLKGDVDAFYEGTAGQ